MTDASDLPHVDDVSSASPEAEPGGSPARPSPDQLSRNWWALAGRGIAAIVFGLIAIVLPGAALLSLAILFSAYLFVDGGFGIVSAVRAARSGERWGWLLAEGALNLVMAIIAFVFPVGAVLAFVLVTAIWAILTGGMILASAFRLNGQHGRWWMALSGVVSILFGLALAVAPMIGAVVLSWWLGAYAIAFGILMIVLAVRLRRTRLDQPPDTGLAEA